VSGRFQRTFQVETTVDGWRDDPDGQVVADVTLTQDNEDGCLEVVTIDRVLNPYGEYVGVRSLTVEETERIEAAALRTAEETPAEEPERDWDIVRDERDGY
jgi:hypothetical protein